MLQVIQGPTKSFWPALCALGLGALAAYTAVAWILQIQSISVAPSVVPNAMQAVAPPSAQNAIQSSHVAGALGAPKAAEGQSGANAGASSDHQCLQALLSRWKALVVEFVKFKGLGQIAHIGARRCDSSVIGTA